MGKNILFKIFSTISCSLLSVCVIISCHSSIENNKLQKNIDPVTNEVYKDSIRSERLKEYADFYIPKINKGVDSFELRILHEPFYAPNAELITFLYTRGGWVILKTTFRGNVIEDSINEERDSSGNVLYPIMKIVTDSFFTKRIYPNVSFNVILDSLKKFDVLDIPDQNDERNMHDFMLIPSKDDIPGLKYDLMDGDDYIIDIAIKNRYNIINYKEPESFEDKDGYNKRIATLIKYVEKISK